MRFKSKEELFHDIPSPGRTVSSKRASRATDNFARWYFEEGLSDGAERAAKGVDSYSESFTDICKSKYPNALREAIDRYLDKKKPLVEFPEPEVTNILIGDEVVGFDIFRSDYVKCLSKELELTLNMLYEYRYRHLGGHKREKRRVVESMGWLLLLILILVLDLPALLIDGPVQALYQLARPLLPWGERSGAHLLIPGFIDFILCGVMGGLLIWKTVAGIPESRERMFTSDTDNHMRTIVTVTALAWPFFLVMRVGVGFSFLESVRLFREAAPGNVGEIILSVLELIVVKGQMLTVGFMLIYAVAILDQISYYLHLLRHEKSILAWEARQVKKDAESQWGFYEMYLKELESTDRQLKFLEIWNQALGGKGKFTGLFDIDSYVKKGERSLLPDNVPLFQEWEARRERSFLREQDGKKEREKQMAALRNQERPKEPAADTPETANEEARREALSQFPLCFDKDGKLARPEEAFSLLRTALGFRKLTPADPYPPNAPGSGKYRDGLQCEREGKHYMVAKEDYEDAAKQGHLLALAHLANIYDTDRNLDSVIAYGDALSVEQWPHTMEHEAEEARIVMGLTPKAPISCLLRRAWHPQTGFDHEVLYYLALHCTGDRNVEEEITRSVCLFTTALLTDAAEQEDARCAFYLADLNFRYYKNRKNSRLWAKVSAGLGYGPAMYFLYEQQKDLGLDAETARMYCYQAWEKNYPPARICAVWDKLTEARRKEMEKRINQAKEAALREARERQKKEQLEAYKKQLEDRERVLNLALRDVYLDDDAAYLAGKMSAGELITGKILKENKLEDYQKKLDRE